jgi:hypothetical protein
MRAGSTRASNGAPGRQDSNRMGVAASGCGVWAWAGITVARTRPAISRTRRFDMEGSRMLVRRCYLSGVPRP